MDIPEFPAITLFCRIISELPKESRDTAISFTCVALGKTPDRTGIPISPDREIRHLYWDNELKDLYERLVFLVTEIRLDEVLIVQGAAAYVEYHFRRWADKDSSSINAASNQNLITQLEHELTLPTTERRGHQSDEQIIDFIGTLRELIETAEQRRIDAENVANYLHARFADAFTLQFWQAFESLRIDRMAPGMERFFRQFDDDASSPEKE